MGKIDVEKMKKIGGIVFNVMVGIILVISILTTVLVFSAQGTEDGIPAIFGKSLLTIETDSMSPTFKPGDMVIMTKLNTEQKRELKKGDIITFYAPKDNPKPGETPYYINTHRIDEEPVPGSDYFKTKGDGNLGQDTYDVYITDIIGVCTQRSARGLGAIISFLGSSLGFFLCIVLPLILFFLYELYRFISLIVAERAKRAPISAEAEEEIKRRAIEEYLSQQNSGDNQNDAPTETQNSDEEVVDK